MLNREHKLTIDDLIVEYLIYKVTNGYQPYFMASEFMDFLTFFEKRFAVSDALYDKEALFKRFFERKAVNDWRHIADLHSYELKYEVVPTMDMAYIHRAKDFKISANNFLGYNDSQVLNTHYMDQIGCTDKAQRIREAIAEYVAPQRKRSINMKTSINEAEQNIGALISAGIIDHIWHYFLQKPIEWQKYPEQCQDINEFLFRTNLPEIVNVKLNGAPVIDEILKLYDALTKRASILYHNDPQLQIKTDNYRYLPRANYDLLIKGNESYMAIAFGPYKESLDINLSALTFNTSHTEQICAFDDDPATVTIKEKIDNEKNRKLVRTINTYRASKRT